MLGASAAYLASFIFRALGWQRLFPGERPDRSRCLAACGAAAASGVVLPFRLDYVVKISTLRRLGGVRLGLETIGLSIITLGLVDAVAMLPLAIAAIATSGAIFRAPLVVVLLFCLGCIGVLALGPRLVLLPLVRRSRRVERIFKRVGDHAGISRSTFAASGFLFGCWTMRALGSTLLLSALGVGWSPSIALVILCMAAAASILPITAGGAIVSVSATSGVLLALGVAQNAAINFSLASGMLLTLTALAAAVIGVGGSLFGTLRRRHLVACNARVARSLRAQLHAAAVLGATSTLPAHRCSAARSAEHVGERRRPGRSSRDGRAAGRCAAVAALVFMNGATPDGRAHPMVLRLSHALARTGHLVFIPDLPGIAGGELSPATLATAIAFTRHAAGRPTRPEVRSRSPASRSAQASLCWSPPSPKLAERRLGGRRRRAVHRPREGDAARDHGDVPRRRPRDSLPGAAVSRRRACAVARRDAAADAGGGRSLCDELRDDRPGLRDAPNSPSRRSARQVMMR